MQEVYAGVLCIADACKRSVTVAFSEIKHFNACSAVFAVRRFQNGEVVGCYHGTLVYQDLSSKEHTRKLYGNGLLKVDAARFSRYALQAQLRRRRLQRGTERLGNSERICVVPAFFCAIAFINDFQYVKKVPE